jgi:hypothetical protein
VSFVITERLLAAAAAAATATAAAAVIRIAVESAALLLTRSFQAIVFGRRQFVWRFSSLELYDASLCLRSVQ